VVLRFVDEFTMNRGSRIAFPVTSASGILLFRSTAELLIAYSNRLKERGANLTAGMDDA
jgi:hypothetical protein